MRYYCYNEMCFPDDPRADEFGNYVVTMSEDEIRETYYPHWQKRMVERFGEEVLEKYTFEDFLDEWIVVNWAWESK